MRITVAGHDQAAVDAALLQVPAEGGEVFFPAGEYRIPKGMAVHGAGLRLTGENALLRFPDPALRYGVQFVGISDGFQMSNLRLEGAGREAVTTLIGADSGAVATNVFIERVHGSHARVGLSMNADRGGRMHGRIDRVTMEYMYGTLSGQGYNFHFANFNGTVRDCIARAGERHAFYCARGKMTTLHSCISIDHRIAIGFDGSVRSAFSLSRGGADAFHCSTIGASGGGMHIAASSLDPEPIANAPAGNNIVAGYHSSGRRDPIAHIVVGEEGNAANPAPIPLPGKASPNVLAGLTIRDGIFDTEHRGVPMQPDIWVWNGRHILIYDNTFVHHGKDPFIDPGDDGTVQRAITVGDSRFAPTRKHIDYVKITGNRFFHDEGAQFRRLTVDGALRDGGLTTDEVAYMEGR